MTTFGELKRGDTFDFINDEKLTENSFYARCRKISRTDYEWESEKFGRLTGHVGSISCPVYHVEPAGQT